MAVTRFHVVFLLAESDPEGPADDFETAADRHSHRPATGCAGAEDARLTVTATALPTDAEDVLLETAADAAIVLAGSPALASVIDAGRGLGIPVIAVDLPADHATDATAPRDAGVDRLLETDLLLTTSEELAGALAKGAYPPDRVFIVDTASPRGFADAAITEIAAFLRRMGS